MHRRLRPARHHFRYRVFALLLDLDELAAMDRSVGLFGHNRAALFSFHDRDHGDGEGLRAWVAAKLDAAGIEAGGPVQVLCYPRILGYVFNPLSVWFCHRPDGALAAIIYEVHNTYNERHAYVLPAGDNTTTVQHGARKAFYVSPFLSQDCGYDFRVRPPGESILIAINEKEAGEPILSAIFEGERRALTGWTLAKMALIYPLMTVKVIAAIHFEAVRLMLKGVRRHAHVPAA